MTIKHISFPSIEQFRSIIKQVRDTAQYFDEPIPELTFTGTVKLHGTNHSVCMSPTGEMYTQSRERVTTPESDNAGSSLWTYANLDTFVEVFNRIKATFDTTNKTIQIYGEWCGGNIQKGVGISNLDKKFIVFAIRISENSECGYFLSPAEITEFCGFHLLHIYAFKTFSINIDFNCPEIAQSTLIKLTEEVEQDCPVARMLLGTSFEGILIGEGIVWTTKYRGNTLRFKVKGDKHSSSKVKTLAPVDIERISSINQFVSIVLTESRLNQGLEHVDSRDSTNTGVFIKWIMSDILKEELDTMAANGFTTKEVSGPVSKVARQWFLQGT